MIMGIVATDLNNGIGLNGKLVSDCPSYLNFFDKITTSFSYNIVVFGRKTAENLQKPLPNRVNIIITRDTNYTKEGFIILHDIQELLVYYFDPISCIWICGGNEIYNLFEPYMQSIFVAKLSINADADTYCDMLNNTNFKNHEVIVRPTECTESKIMYDVIRYNIVM